MTAYQAFVLAEFRSANPAMAAYFQALRQNAGGQAAAATQSTQQPARVSIPDGNHGDNNFCHTNRSTK